VAVSFIGEGTGIPAASHWQTLSHNVVSSTPEMATHRTKTTQNKVQSIHNKNDEQKCLMFQKWKSNA
jgi:hypothetical protein